jgi:hypothetical protein
MNPGDRFLRVTSASAPRRLVAAQLDITAGREVLADRPADEVASASSLLGTLATALDAAARVKGDRR